MITTERISNWLNEPHQLQEVSPRALLQFANAYPYFTPAHYLKFITLKQDAITLFALQQAHPVNQVLLGDLLLKARETVPAVPSVVEMNIAETSDADYSTFEEKTVGVAEDAELVMPVSANDYFLQQGIHVPGELPELQGDKGKGKEAEQEGEKEKSLMVVMSFSEWLNFIHFRGRKAREEEEDQKAFKTMWQKQKLTAAIEEGSEEIPEQVFEMAVNSIAQPNELISESLAEVYVKQGKKEKAIDMYKKLSLQNPEKNTYFAAKIENLQKDL